MVPSVMLAAHMDEIGLMVTYVSDDGFLSVSAVGGVDAAILPGMRVDVHTAKGPLRGVVGRKPIHLIEADERKKVTPISDLVIDLGMSAKKVKKRVRIRRCHHLRRWVRAVRPWAWPSRVHSTTNAESGLPRAFWRSSKRRVARQATSSLPLPCRKRLARAVPVTTTYGVNPDVGLAFDVTHATDYPGISKSKYGDIRCGGGPVIARGPNINPVVFERLVAAAEAEGVPYQLEAEPAATGHGRPLHPDSARRQGVWPYFGAVAVYAHADRGRGLVGFGGHGAAYRALRQGPRSRRELRAGDVVHAEARGKEHREEPSRAP